MEWPQQYPHHSHEKIGNTGVAPIHANVVGPGITYREYPESPEWFMTIARIPFRALLVTYLTATMPGKLCVGRWDMNWGGVIVALIKRAPARFASGPGVLAVVELEGGDRPAAGKLTTALTCLSTPSDDSGSMHSRWFEAIQSRAPALPVPYAAGRHASNR